MDIIIHFNLEINLKKIVFTLLLTLSTLFASLSVEYPSHKILDSKIPIVDIRTPGEWKETGLLKGSIPIMFFNEQGGYDIDGFLTELNKKVDTTKPFAIICRTASRTRIVGDFLSKKLHYQVIDLAGGMVYVKAKNLPITPYK